MEMIKGKIVVITGASSGIGAEMAVLLAKYGAIPVLLARSITKLNTVAERITGEHRIYETDVSSAIQVSDTMQSIVKHYGKIDILINNAGFAIFETLEQAALKHYEEMMDVNYMGLVRCTKAALPAMLERGSGHIINVASIAGLMGSPKSTAYTASKHAVVGFTRSLRLELLGINKNIHVSLLNPGPIRTPFFNTADPEGHYLSKIPKWFILQPEQVARAVMDLIVHQRAERTIPRIAGIAVKCMNLFSGSLDRLIYKVTNRK